MRTSELINSRLGALDEENLREIINRYCWNLTMSVEHDIYMVFAGEKVLVKGNVQEINAFLLGMATAYSILPEATRDLLLEHLKINDADCLPDDS